MFAMFPGSSPVVVRFFLTVFAFGKDFPFLSPLNQFLSRKIVKSGQFQPFPCIPSWISLRWRSFPLVSLWKRTVTLFPSFSCVERLLFFFRHSDHSVSRKTPVFVSTLGPKGRNSLGPPPIGMSSFLIKNPFSPEFFEKVLFYLGFRSDRLHSPPLNSRSFAPSAPTPMPFFLSLSLSPALWRILANSLLASFSHYSSFPLSPLFVKPYRSISNAAVHPKPALGWSFRPAVSCFFQHLFPRAVSLFQTLRLLSSGFLFCSAPSSLNDAFLLGPKHLSHVCLCCLLFLLWSSRVAERFVRTLIQ